MRSEPGTEREVAADVFNEMVEKLDEHTKQILEGEKRQYASQMKMLSYQLNPHFIYNTLNAVICLAKTAELYRDYPVDQIANRDSPVDFKDGSAGYVYRVGGTAVY